MPRIVADLGNSRLKWGLVDATGRLTRSIHLPLDDETTWARAWADWEREAPAAASWSIGSVNPPVAARLAAFLTARGVGDTTWYRSAADVPVGHVLRTPGTTGADRALAVRAALGGIAGAGGTGPGIVVLCGTAVTVERVGADGVWQGGAIAAGLGLSARALHALTAQLPLVTPVDQPPAWGDATRPALEAGVFWGVVGAARELLTRQMAGLGQDDRLPWLIWSGGDAEVLARAVAWPGAVVVPDLVLLGVARVVADREGS